MSRIGKKPIAIPDKVKVTVSSQTVTVDGGKSKLSFTFKPLVSVKVDKIGVVVERQGDSREARALHGTTRALIANMIKGVTTGFAKELEVVGVGWSAALKGQSLELNVGYADPRVVPIPAGLKVEVAQNKIKVSGPDKQVVGQFAAVVRSQRPPEPYNGKGIKYSDERIVRKQGKAFAGAATA